MASANSPVRSETVLEQLSEPEKVSLKSAQKCISYRKRLDQVEWVGDTREITFMNENP